MHPFALFDPVLVHYGAVHKARHARGEGVREGVTVCDRGMGGQEHVTSRL